MATGSMPATAMLPPSTVGKPNSYKLLIFLFFSGIARIVTRA